MMGQIGDEVAPSLHVVAIDSPNPAFPINAAIPQNAIVSHRGQNWHL
jgi:hypothetical protein